VGEGSGGGLRVRLTANYQLQETMEDGNMEIFVGKVTHFYDKINVAVLNVTQALKLGDTIAILGRITDFTQPVFSMEIDHQKIEAVGPGTEIALKVIEPVRKGDEVYKIEFPDV
jgi:putative protease